MKKTAVIILLVAAGLSCASGLALAKLIRYTYPYDISYIEWELLSMSSAWRGSSSLADPFVLENMVFDRQAKIIHIYLEGKPEQATEVNLNKSIEEIKTRLLEKFADFEINSDLTVHYDLVPSDGKKTFRMEFNQGAFKTLTN